MTQAAGPVFTPPAGYDWRNDHSNYGTKNTDGSPKTGGTNLTPTSDSYASASSPSLSTSTSASGQGLPTGESTPSYTGGDGTAGPGFGAKSANATQGAANPWEAPDNVGSPYNSNIQLVDQSAASQYKNTNTFTNSSNSAETVVLWNKTGPDGQPNSGQNLGQPVTFTLQPGQSQTVAFDDGSSVAWSVAKDGKGAPGANNGQTWGEATFNNSATGWSAYDVSQISPGGHNGNMSITNNATGQTQTQANAWQSQSDDPAGKDVGVPGGPLHLGTVLS